MPGGLRETLRTTAACIMNTCSKEGEGKKEVLIHATSSRFVTFLNYAAWRSEAAASSSGV